MLRSLSESLRSLWHSGTHETIATSSRKRKRPSDEAFSEDDSSDVEVVSIKRPKPGDQDSSSGFLSYITVPMSKMSEWVRKKTVRQDHFFYRPVPSACRLDKVHAEREQHVSQNACDAVYVKNGPSINDRSQNTEGLLRIPEHSQNGADKKVADANGDVHSVERETGACSSSAHSSRHSSCSSFRQETGRQSIADKCFQWREKEKYLKLLQQHTTVDLGYHTKTKRVNHLSGCSHLNVQSQRKPASFLQAPSSPSLYTHLTPDSVATKLDSLLVSSPLPVTPSRFVRSSSHSSNRTVNQQAPSLSDTVSVALSASCRPSRPLQVSSTSCHSHRSQEPSLLSTKQGDEAVPLSVAPTDAETSPVAEDKISKKPCSLSFKSSEFLDEAWLTKLKSRYAATEDEYQQLIKAAEIKKVLLEKRRESRLANLDKKLKLEIQQFDQEPGVIEERPLPEVPQEKPLPVLTNAMLKTVHEALDSGPANKVVSEGFRLKLTRSDILTLKGSNWLNDEVINFYMNLLMERGKQENNPKTYAFNTFFYPKLIQSGYDSVKRWTRQVDIFAHDYLVIPVHLGVHWCLCMVFMKDKKICYYDSMSGNNNQCLNSVWNYLGAESLAKKQVKMDMSQWTVENVKDIPQQMNGSDCGVFTCMYAETLTRGEKITFTQANMPFFRLKMVYEILKKLLL